CVFAPIFLLSASAACARSAQSFVGPTPASGFCIRIAAIPHPAIAHEGSCASTSRNDFSVSAYRNECSSATDRWKLSWTAGLHEFWKSTLPSCSCGWLRPMPGTHSANESSNMTMTVRVLIEISPSVDDEQLRADTRV